MAASSIILANAKDPSSQIRGILHDRVVGTLVGSALGDAIGLYTEFMSKTQAREFYPSEEFSLVEPKTPYKQDTHRGPHNPGNWTDDTDHALCMLLSYLHSSGKDNSPTPGDLAARIRLWANQGLRALDTMPLGLGKTVGTIVIQQGFLEEPEEIATKHWRKNGRDAAANGSLMRTHPVGLFGLLKTREETLELAGRLSCITHVDPRCVASCALGSALVRGLVLGEVTTEEQAKQVMEETIVWYDCKWKPTMEKKKGNEEGEWDLDVEAFRKHAWTETLDELVLDDIAMGYVLKCLGTGVLQLRKAMRMMKKGQGGLKTQLSVFKELIAELIMCGGDADTNACFAGALLGAYLGYKALPPHWRDGLNHGDWFMNKAESLSILLGVRDGEYDGGQDKDTAHDGGRGLLEQDEMEKRWALLVGKVFAAHGVAPTPKKPSRASWLPWSSEKWKGRY
ncbi:ADP-ribosylglycohydrolase [Zalerion maritima]|uniref:ADP-ribosylglycohydrolase n=1 Tax=Zalerion maritima TaxID=339359 RepID=A0AAD5RVV6_9PEZI|nr:ADP-ribosylglycohydrolase [Zalerion maritima]